MNERKIRPAATNSETDKKLSEGSANYPTRSIVTVREGVL